MTRLPILVIRFISSSAIVCSLVLLSTTSGALAKSAAPAGHTFSGYSHHYADRFHGKRTASGQAHDKFKLTAAHRTLPFGTHLHVTNERNGKSCVVVVNDRGPFGSQSLVLDVSKAAAHKLGFPGGGKIPVTCKVIDPKAGAIALKELEPDRLVIAEKIAGKKTAPTVNVNQELNKIAKTEPAIEKPVVNKPQPKVEIAAKPQAVSATTPVASSHTVTPPKVAVASKPQPEGATAHQMIAHATTPAAARVMPAVPEAPNHGTFLLVINDALESDQSPKTAEYNPAKSHHNHSPYAPTVFMKVDDGAGKSSDKNHAPAQSIADNKILM